MPTMKNAHLPAPAPPKNNFVVSHMSVDLDDDDLEVVLVVPQPPELGDASVEQVVVHVDEPGVLAVLAASRAKKNNSA